MFNRLIATGLLAISLLWLVACGAGGAGLPDTRDESHSGTGVRAGNFEVIRYNVDGFPDPSLNSTLSLALTNKGGQTALVINVKDSINTGTVAVDVHFDSGSVHPQNVVFHGALGDDDQVLSASFLNQVPGLAALGQTGIRDYRPAVIDGRFATVTFSSGGLRAVSAIDGVHTSTDGVGDVYGDAEGNAVGGSAAGEGLPNIIADDDQTAHPGETTVSWYASWHLADGNQNGIVEIADLSPLGKHLNKSVATNWDALPADYNGDGLVTVADLSKMGKHLTEGTSTYLLEVGDNDGSTSGLTTIGNFDWTLNPGEDWTAPTDPNNATPPVPESLEPVFKKWSFTLNDASTPPIADVSALDTAGNIDGIVTFHITPQRAGQNGVPGRIDAEVEPPDTTRYITVNNVSIRVAGATGGGDDGTLFDDDNLLGAVVANSTIDISIDGISGQYSSLAGGGTFDANTLPADMTQQDYDDTLAIVKGNPTPPAVGFVSWAIANGGAAGFRYRSDWLTFTPPNPPLFGDLGQGTVFPDDDPESTGATSEGALSVNLALSPDQDGAPGRSIILQPYSQTYLFDVTADPNAPVLEDPFDLANGETATTLTLLEGTQLSMDLTAPNPIVDPTTTELTLLEIGPNGGVIGTPVNFTYAPGAPSQGDFFFRSVDPPSIQAWVSGIAINPSSQYHFTFKDDSGGPYSSLNTPEAVLTTVDPPPPADLVTVPNRIGNAGSGYTTILIMLPEPKIRRDPRLNIDILNETVDPIESIGFNDVLKMSGDEFIIGTANGSVYPRLTLIKNNPPDPNFGPDLITASTVGDSAPIVLERTPGYVKVDLLGLEDVPSGELLCAYKLFNENDSAVGQGEFIKQSLRFDDPSPFPVAWGVNAFDRENTASATIADLNTLYANKTINHANNGSARPDVLWFQFNGGYMFNEQPAFNTQAVFEWWDGNGNDFSDSIANVDLRVAGIAPNGDYLALHVVVEEDYYGGGGNGNFIDGMGYIVHLDDPKYPGAWQATYGIGNPDGDDQMLLVINQP